MCCWKKVENTKERKKTQWKWFWKKGTVIKKKHIDVVAEKGKRMENDIEREKAGKVGWI